MSDMEARAARNWIWFLMLLFVATLGLFGALVAYAAVPLEVSCPQSACVVYRQSAIFTETGKPFQVSWTPVAAADTYQVNVMAFPPKAGALPIKSVVVPGATPEAALSIPRAGQWFVRVRPCTGTVCAAWAVSYDPLVTDPVAFASGFYMVIKVASTGGGTVE
jgi:hypothetical protein